MESNSRFPYLPPFKIAFTFTGEYRERIVRPTCEALLGYGFTKEEIFFDEWHSALFTGVNADSVFRRIYHDVSACVVALLSPNYKDKNWTFNLEWPTVRALINEGNYHKICLLRVGGVDISTIEGLFPSRDVARSVDAMNPVEIADFIFAWYSVHVLQEPLQYSKLPLRDYSKTATQDSQNLQIEVPEAYAPEKETVLLRDYLDRVRKLEIDVYTIGKTIEYLKTQFREVSPKKNIICPPKPEKPHLYDFEKTKNPIKEQGSMFWWNLNSAGTFTETVGDLFRVPFETIKENKRIQEYNKEKEIENAVSTKKYELELKHYNEVLLPNFEHEVSAESARYQADVDSVRVFNDGLNKCINYLTEEKDNSEIALHKMYSIGIVYPKYYGLIPVTMFCEYMDSMRRTVLGGVHGMYDLYETELRSKQIVSSLSTVNEGLKLISYQIGGIANQLSGIQRNQILLYEEVALGNDIAKRIGEDTIALLHKASSTTSILKGAMTETDDRQPVIQSSVEMVAYNNEITAHRIESTGRIQEFEHSLRHPIFSNK